MSYIILSYSLFSLLCSCCVLMLRHFISAQECVPAHVKIYLKPRQGIFRLIFLRINSGGRLKLEFYFSYLHQNVYFIWIGFSFIVLFHCFFSLSIELPFLISLFLPLAKRPALFVCLSEWIVRSYDGHMEKKCDDVTHTAFQLKTNAQPYADQTDKKIRPIKSTEYIRAFFSLLCLLSTFVTLWCAITGWERENTNVSH